MVAIDGILPQIYICVKYSTSTIHSCCNNLVSLSFSNCLSCCIRWMSCYDLIRCNNNYFATIFCCLKCILQRIICSNTSLQQNCCDNNFVAIENINCNDYVVANLLPRDILQPLTTDLLRCKCIMMQPFSIYCNEFSGCPTL
jgi:hypothetical protein